jgi:23S rRNA (guanosine2251-2'-O)-methyltransferase
MTTPPRKTFSKPTTGAKGKHWFPSKEKKPYFPKGGVPRAANPDAPKREPDRVLAVTPGNDLIYGAHPVSEALKNPKRKPVKLWATENAALRLKEDAPGLSIEPEIVHPRLLDHMLKSADAFAPAAPR